MGCIRPATPGFLCTLVATILLAIVSFCVPYFKSVYFLKADVSESGVSGSITFGTLGYCYEFQSVTNCSKPSVGYELDINSLVGDNTKLQIPQVAVKWLTYALVLHIVALALAAGSAVFGLLAHVREMSMTCCSTCVSGFAAAVAMLAFIFDLALFFIAKARINAIGHATIGNAIWLTLIAWLLLFFSGCFYTLGRCCISNRGPRNDKWKKDHENAPNSTGGGAGNGYNNYAEQMRLDAVKSEMDRKKHQELGLPAFSETQPLTARVDGESVYTESYHDHTPTAAQAGYGRRPPGAGAGAGGYAGGGYVQAPVGSRAIDEYYSPTRDAAAAGAGMSTYPPHPRQNSSHTYAPSNYAPSTYSNQVAQPAAYNNQGGMRSPPPNTQFLAAPGLHDRAATATSQNSQVYGHTGGGTTYHSAHEQYPSSYSQYEQPQADPYGVHSQPYNPTAYYGQSHNAGTPDRNYTGDGYGANSVPPLPERSGSVPALPEHPSTAGFVPYSTGSPSPSLPTPSVPSQSSIPAPQRTTSPQHYEDSPPGYDAGSGEVTGAWGKR